MLTCAVATELLEVVSWRRPKVLERFCRVKNHELPEGRPLDLRRKAPYRASAEQALGRGISEAPNHGRTITPRVTSVKGPGGAALSRCRLAAHESSGAPQAPPHEAATDSEGGRSSDGPRQAISLGTSRTRARSRGTVGRAACRIEEAPAPPPPFPFPTGAAPHPSLFPPRRPGAQPTHPSRSPSRRGRHEGTNEPGGRRETRSRPRGNNPRDRASIAVGCSGVRATPEHEAKTATVR